uniref:protein xylosyltransferase n=1 Tax=Scapholeberis mucronata TaxID=202097 RepID=A0A4Y7NJN9_9CRUS|nr:EOG090X01AN [Scapholeberis mucronata]SVE93458.1 EOG090X01AN [Scapholeberis mucronata]
MAIKNREKNPPDDDILIDFGEGSQEIDQKPESKEINENVSSSSSTLRHAWVSLKSLPFILGAQTESRPTLHETSDGLEFVYPCGALGKTATSAVKRATTQKCKEEIKDIACRHKNNQLVPDRLPNYCPRKGSVPGHLLGCFHDYNQSRLLTSYGVKLQGLTIQKCIDLCAQSAHLYAGVHNGRECYCGNKKPSLEHLLTKSYCSVPCDGQSSQTCGGLDATEVFDTGVPSRDSAKLQDPIVNGSAKIAFILTLNGRALRQVTRLLKVIYRPHHVYLIHVDARQDFLFRNLLPLESQYSNIRLVRNRHSSIWGGASLLDVLLESMEQLLKIDSHWQFVFNLSESDFPLRSIESLEALLAANPDRNFLKSHGRQTRQFIHKQGLDRVFHQCESRMWRLGDRNLPAGIRIDGGSDWVGLTRQLVEYATSSANTSDPLLRGLRDLYRYTLLPAESFFHVLVLNSKFCDSYADNNLRMTLWRRSQGCLCQHRNVVDWCGCSPMVFRTADWTHLTSMMAKSTVFFARKFEAALDQSIMNRLEEQLTNISLSFPGLDCYWESAYDVSDSTPKQNPAVLTVATKLAKHALTLQVQNSLNECSGLQPNQIVAITSYFRHDHYQGDLIQFEVEGENVKFETLVKPLDKTSHVANTPRVLSTFLVGSDYDPKELVLRNRLGVLSPTSKPVAVYKWASHVNNTFKNAHLVWFDPNNHVKAVHSVNVTNTSKMNSQQLELRGHLNPGVWMVLFIVDGKKTAVTEFLVVPQVDEPITSTLDVKDKQPFDSWEKYSENEGNLIKSRRERTALMENDISTFLDKTVVEFYSIQDICYIEQLPNCARDKRNHYWQACSMTDWSSLSQDPKSKLVR